MEKFETKGRVLLVGNDDIFRNSVFAALQADRYQTFSAQNGQEALQMVRTESAHPQFFDLLITDIKMAPVSGLELIGKLAQQGFAIPTLAMSSSSNKKLLVELMRRGCADFIDKPFDMAELLARVESLIPNSRREAEKELPSEEQMIQLALAWEHAGEGICITDSQGFISYANPAYEKITGYSLEEILGGKISFEEGPPSSTLFAQSGPTPPDRAEVWQGSVRGRRKNGGKLEEQLTIQPITDAAGIITNYVCICRDVTEQNLLENRLHHVQKMEALGNFTEEIVHNFNNILQVVSSYAGLIRNALPPESSVAPDLKTIEEATRRAKELVSQILFFGRNTPAEPKSVDITNLLHNALGLLEKIKPKTISVETELSREPLVVLGVETALHSLLLNLFLNACQAMPAGGTLQVSLQPAGEAPHGVPDSNRGRYGYLMVKDNGVGMDRETLSQCFDPFFTTKEPDLGTGLGLFTVKKTIAQLRGSYSLVSELGQGTTFKIYLPLVEDFSKGGNSTQVGDVP